MDKSIIKIILNYYNQLIISTLIIIINNIILDFSRTLILTKLIEKVLIFFIILLLSGILSRVHFDQVNNGMSHILLSKIKRVVYLVIRAAFSCWSCFLIVQCITLSGSLPCCSSSSRFQKYVTQCSPSLKENHIDKNLIVNTLQLSNG